MFFVKGLSVSKSRRASERVRAINFFGNKTCRQLLDKRGLNTQEGSERERREKESERERMRVRERGGIFER